MLTRHQWIAVSPASTMKENPLQYRVRATPVPTTRTRGTNYPESTCGTLMNAASYAKSVVLLGSPTAQPRKRHIVSCRDFAKDKHPVDALLTEMISINTRCSDYLPPRARISQPTSYSAAGRSLWSNVKAQVSGLAQTTRSGSARHASRGTSGISQAGFARAEHNQEPRQVGGSAHR